MIDPRVEDDLIIEARHAELVMAVSGCSAARALALVRGTGTETPFDRLVLALGHALRHIGASGDVSI